MTIRTASVLNLMLLSTAGAQSPLWIRQIGTPVEDRAILALADGSGGVYVGGYTSGDLFGSNLGQVDAWLARYDNAGTLIWARQFGTTSSDAAVEAVSDGSAGIFLAGISGGNLSSTTADSWLAHYDSVGTQNWLRTIVASPASDFAFVAVSGGPGAVYVGGGTYGDLEGPNHGGVDAWLGRYDSAGNQVWIRQFGTSDDEAVYGAAPDASGGGYVSGYSADPLTGEEVETWLAHYDNAGTQLWKHYFGLEYQGIDTAAPDGSGGVYLTGSTTAVLGPTPVGGEDAWLARFDSAGNRLWIRQFGSTLMEDSWVARADGFGGVYVGGYTRGNLAGPNAGDVDAWWAHYDSTGMQISKHQLGASIGDWVVGAAPDGSGGAFILGMTGISLEPPNTGANDAWLVYYPCYPNCDHSTTAPLLNVNDFVCFLNSFAAGATYANCDHSTTAPVLNILDFTCFLNAFATGCP